MAFQSNAFQNNAFQIAAGQKQQAYKRVWLPEAKKKYEEYERAVKVLEQAEAPLDKKRLEAVTSIYKTEEEFQPEDMQYLMANEIALRKLDLILESIKQLEDDMLEILALLLIANEVI